MRADNLLPILEAAYDLSRDAAASLDAIATASASVIDAHSMLIGFEIPRAGDLRTVLRRPIALTRADERLLEAGKQLTAGSPAPGGRALLRSSPRFWIGTEQFAGTAFLARAREVGVAEFGVVHAADGLGGGINLTSYAPEVTGWSPALRAQWSAVAEHLGAAWRLRRTLGAPAPDVELRPDGKVRHSRTPLNRAARDALRRAVLMREAARSRRRGVHPERLWPALVEGRWSLIDTFDAGGTRHVIAVENPPAAEQLRALPLAERAVIEHVAAGRSGKWIALELGISEATVSRLAQRAMRRMGARELTALTAVRAAVFEPLDGTPQLAAARLEIAAFVGRLTPAEVDIVRMLVEGRSVAAIAVERGTSPRTVAHQLTALYAKAGVASRRELLARFS